MNTVIRYSPAFWDRSICSSSVFRHSAGPIHLALNATEGKEDIATVTSIRKDGPTIWDGGLPAEKESGIKDTNYAFGCPQFRILKVIALVEFEENICFI